MTETCPQGVFTEKMYWEKQLQLAQAAVEAALKELERINEREN